MTAWTRIAPLGGRPRSRQQEVWEYGEPGAEAPRRFALTVDIGKPLDVLGLKRTDLGETRAYAGFLARMAARLYDPAATRRLPACPACLADADGAAEAFRIFDVPYVRCHRCGHGFVREQPMAAALDAVFADSEDHSAAYTDPAAVEVRMRQVIGPKIAWVLEVFGRACGGRPTRAIDVGAGGGHFVAGLHGEDIAAEGYELSAASRRFAAAVFDLELRGDDFLAAPAEPVDLVTFWGLLEYTPEPRRFLEAARRRLAPGRGLLAVEVPRLDCLGTAAQAANPWAVARHMDPTSHVNAFTDGSLATALVETGFAPVAAWYFGMDAYELLVQAALRLDEAAVLDRLADMIPGVQASLDAGRQCDDLVMAALPVD